MRKHGGFDDDVFADLLELQVSKMQELHDSFFGHCSKCPLYTACAAVEKRIEGEIVANE